MDAFVHTYVETQSVILDKLVVTITWKSTIGFWDTEKLAELKKLQWCIANCRSERQKEQQCPSLSALSVCKQCYNRRSIMKQGSGGGQDHKNSCVLCAAPACFKCQVQRTLTVIDEHSGRLTDQVVVVCQSCLMFVQKLRPTDIVRLNYKQRVRHQRAST